MKGIEPRARSAKTDVRVFASTILTLERVKGIEPRARSAKTNIRGFASTHLTLERVKGIEPSSLAWEAVGQSSDFNGLGESVSFLALDWSGLRESNPSQRLGKPTHYHYAKPAQAFALLLIERLALAGKLEDRPGANVRIRWQFAHTRSHFAISSRSFVKLRFTTSLEAIAIFFEGSR